MQPRREVPHSPYTHWQTSINSAGVKHKNNFAPPTAAVGSSLTYGLAVNSKVPLGKVYNIPFEPYGAKRIGFGATGMLTYSKDALYPEEALNLHFNLAGVGGSS